VRQEHAAYHAKVKALVEMAQEAGVLDSGLDATDMMETVVVFVDGLGVAAALDPDTYTPEALDQKMRSFLRSLGWRDTPPA